MRAIFGLGPRQAYALPASEWFALAYRLPYYPGVLQAKAMTQSGNNGQHGNTSNTSNTGARSVPATRLAILSDPNLSAVVSFGGA